MALPHGPGAARGAWRARRGSLSLLSSLEVPTGRGRRAAVCARVVDTRIWRMAGTNQLELVVVKVFVSSRVPLCICAGGRVCLCVSVCVPRHPRAHRIHTACVLFFVCWFVAGKSGRVVQRARSRAVWVRRSHRASLDRPPRPGPCALPLAFGWPLALPPRPRAERPWSPGSTVVPGSTRPQQLQQLSIHNMNH